MVRYAGLQSARHHWSCDSYSSLMIARDDCVTVALDAESAADDGVLRPDWVGLDRKRTVGDAGESHRLEAWRGRVCASCRGRAPAELLV